MNIVDKGLRSADLFITANQFTFDGFSNKSFHKSKTTFGKFAKLLELSKMGLQDNI